VLPTSSGLLIMSLANTIFLRVAPLLFGALVSSCSGGGSGSSVAVQGGGVNVATAEQSLNYHEHTKAVIDSRCVTCHHEGGQAPFSLTQYTEVAAKKSAIVYALESEAMPLLGFATISDAERDILIQWLEEGAVEGIPEGNTNTTPYTYYGHTKAIIEQKCSNCHSPGEIAPFSLNDYESVYAVRSAIAHQVDSDAMPPWPPTNHYMPLKNNRSLTDDEKGILNSWIAAGAPSGNPADYVPVVKEESQIEYNLTIGINEPYTPVARPDEYRCLMIDWPLDHTVYVNAVNVIPDAKAQVHHVFAVVVNPDQLPAFEAADGADGRPGFPCWGAPSPEDAIILPRTLTVWAPGITPGALPEGTGVRIDPGSKIAMQMHYNTINTEPQPDQSSLQLRYVEEVEREALTMFFLDIGWYSPGGMPIPAGDPNVTVQYTADLGFSLGISGGAGIGLSPGQPFAMHTAFLHQHVLGKSTSIELIRADGTQIMLVDIRDWDFDWQDEYVFEEEVIVQPGDKFRLTCTWDNSASHQQFIQGEQIDPQYVEFGEGTVDEMCVNYFYITRVADEDVGKVQDFAPTVAFYQPKHLQVFNPGDYVPIELLLNSFKLQEPPLNHLDHEHEEEIGHEHVHHSGHYHIYLDSEDDAADHLTRWDSSTFYQLPDDIQAGQHTLRVSLRSDSHEAVGVENRVTFVVEEAASNTAVESLIDVAGWQPQSAADDTWTDHRPAQFECPDNAWFEEDGALEVETGYCTYFSVAQPSKAEINKGDEIHLVLWHGQLRFDEPTEAHVAVTIKGEVIWEDNIEIPNAGGVYDISVPSTVSAAAGETVEFHLHNHGYNSWTLLTLEVQH
jgi:mono/diheme cytochrome c family protein